MREYIVVWADNDTGVWISQDNGNATKFYFNMPRKVKLIQALNTPTTIQGYVITGALAAWNHYFGFSTNKLLLDDHDANPMVDYSGRGRSPKG